MTLTKVTDGLSLARMLLCQLCGLDLSTPVMLTDEQKEDLAPTTPENGAIDINNVYATRPEVRSLELATQIYKQKVNVTRSEYLPSIALMGSYMATNPSVFNSFEKKFKGMWNVGVMVSVPIWHWGEGIYKVKAAKSEARIAQYQLDDDQRKDRAAGQPVGFPSERSCQETDHGPKKNLGKSQREPEIRHTWL